VRSLGLHQPTITRIHPTTLPYSAVSVEYARIKASEFNETEIVSGYLTNNYDDDINVFHIDNICLPAYVSNKRIHAFRKLKQEKALMKESGSPK
jgi:hypothetical protein